MRRLIFDEDIYSEVVEKGMVKAQRSLWIATANVKNMIVQVDRHHKGSVIDLFETLVGRGVEVRILHSGVPSGQFIEVIKKSPVVKSPLFDMKRCVRTHFKCVLVDSGLIYLGSANMTGAGMGMKSRNKRNFETGIITDEDFIMDEMAEYFNAIWTGARCDSCGRKKECVVPLESAFK